MGIRCYCPNHHRLNLKSYLAGQRGVCPECGARFIIPMESDPSIKPRSKRAAAAAQPGDDAPTVVEDISVDAPLAEPVETEQAEADASVFDADDFETSVLIDQVALPPTGVGSTALPQQEAPAANAYVAPPPAAVATADPIAAGGLSMWYVRHPDGGQYGPAPPEVFRAWLGEGRIGPDSLVWREGWQQWQGARDVFAELRATAVAPAPPPPPPAPQAPPTPPPGPPQAAAPAVIPGYDAPSVAVVQRTRSARDRRKSQSMALLIFLAMIVIGLVPILIWVIL